MDLDHKYSIFWESPIFFLSLCVFIQFVFNLSNGGMMRCIPISTPAITPSHPKFHPHPPLPNSNHSDNSENKNFLKRVTKTLYPQTMNGQKNLCFIKWIISFGGFNLLSFIWLWRPEKCSIFGLYKSFLFLSIFFFNMRNEWWYSTGFFFLLLFLFLFILAWPWRVARNPIIPGRGKTKLNARKFDMISLRLLLWCGFRSILLNLLIDCGLVWCLWHTCGYIKSGG